MKQETKKCIRCRNKFLSSPLIKGDDICSTCDRMNDITFWYPKLFHLGFPIPKTIIIHTNLELERLPEKLEGFDKFIMHLKEAICEVGTPAFLRTGYSSDKHRWKDTCFIDTETAKHGLAQHVFNLVEFIQCATIDRFMPCDFWAVREFIKAKIYFTAFSGEMPITKERRFFVRNGKVECHHSYWPKEVFDKIDKKLFKELSELSKEDEKELIGMATYIANIFHGYWSCDFLKSESGQWYLTDMAIGEESYHQEHIKS